MYHLLPRKPLRLPCSAESRPLLRKKLLPALAGAVLITALFPGIALADPPQAIPANYEEADGK